MTLFWPWTPAVHILASHILTTANRPYFLAQGLAETVRAGGVLINTSMQPGTLLRGPVFMKESDLPARGLWELFTPHNPQSQIHPAMHRRGQKTGQ